MRVSDVMSTNVVTIPSDTSLAAARRVLDAHGFRRLPVVDRGKLVGIVTKDTLDRTGPSQLTTFSIHEVGYLLNKITVREVMRRDVLTVTPDMTVEEAVSLAQTRRVGALVVVDEGHVVGMCTTNDFFYKVLNPILGIGMPGSRIVIRDCFEAPDVERVLHIINQLNVKVMNLFTIEIPGIKRHDLILHLDVPDPGPIAEAVQKLGCSCEPRAR